MEHRCAARRLPQARAGCGHIAHGGLPAFDSDYRAANARLAGIIRRHAPRLLGFAFVHCRRDKGRIAAIAAEAVQQHGFRGIKVHDYEAMLTCEAARAYQQKVTRVSAVRDYVVVRRGERADFDGKDAGRGVLLDAKPWCWDGKHAQALRVLDPREPKRALPGTASYVWALRDVIGLVDRAQRQARVAGGRPVEWHISDAGTARLLRRLMAVTFGCPCGPQRCLCPVQVRYRAS